MNKVKALSSFIILASLGLLNSSSMAATDNEQFNEHRILLEKQAVFATKHKNLSLEQAALSRLALIMNNDSPEYRLMFIRSLFRQGGNAKDAATLHIRDLCNRFSDSFACKQAKALEEINTAEMKLKLQPFYMYETNSNYIEAVKAIEDLFGGAPIEEGLRFRYLIMLGHVEGRENEAIRGLKTIMDEDPSNTYLATQIPALINTFRVNGLTNSAIRHFHISHYRQDVKRDIEKALKIDPNGPQSAYLREMLTEIEYWEYIDAGDVFLEKGNYQKAIQSYKLASKKDETSPYAYIGMARCASNMKDFAMLEEYSALAIKYSYNESKGEQQRITKLMQSLKADIYIANADEALKNNDQKQATKELEKALALDKDNPWLYYKMASLKAETHGTEEGEAVFLSLGQNKLKRPEYTYPYAQYLSNIGNYQKAITVMGNLCKKNDYKEFCTSLNDQLLFEKLEQDIQKAENDGDLKRAREIRLKLLAQNKSNPWLVYAVAKSFADNQQNKEALMIFDYYVAPEDLKTVDYAYPYALILNKVGKTDEALSQLEPHKDNDQKCADLYNSIQMTRRVEALENAYQIGTNNDKARIKDELQKLDAIEARKALAGIYYNEEDYASALDLYKKIYEDESRNSNTSNNSYDFYLLRILECAQEINDSKEESKALGLIESRYNQLSFSDKRSYAKLLSKANQTKRSIEVYKDLEETIFLTANIDAREKAWLYRDMAQSMPKTSVSERLQYTKNGLESYSEISYSDDYIFTKNLRTTDTPNDDWLYESLKTNASDLYLLDAWRVVAGFQYLRDSGHAGYSDSRGQLYILNISKGLFGGRLQFQTDTYKLNVGKTSNLAYEDMFGTCFATGCEKREHSRTATTIALGWDGYGFNVNLGTAPKIDNNGNYSTNAIVGSFGYSFDIDKFTMELKAYKKAKDNSLLTYYGDVDPNTGRGFGAVKATGIRFDLGYSFNEYSGLWGNTQYEVLRGQNVEDNSDYRIMGGYYNHLIYQPNRRLTIGPSAMYWSYDKDLSGYTFGQGGYYSPQQYLSTGVSLTWRERTDNWTWKLRGSISESYSKTDAISRYPGGFLNTYEQMSISDIDTKSTSDSSWSFGTELEGAVEYRVGYGVSFGASGKIAKSKDYDPSYAMLYLKWIPNWNGDLPLGPEEPIRYTEW